MSGFDHIEVYVLSFPANLYCQHYAAAVDHRRLKVLLVLLLCTSYRLKRLEDAVSPVLSPLFSYCFFVFVSTSGVSGLTTTNVGHCVRLLRDEHVQFSSAHDGIYAHGKAHMRPPFLSKVSPMLLLKLFQFLID